MIVYPAYAFMKKADAKMLDMWSGGKVNVEYTITRGTFNSAANRFELDLREGTVYFVIPDSRFTKFTLNVNASGEYGGFMYISIQNPSGTNFTTVTKNILVAAQDFEIAIPEAARSAGNRIKIYNAGSYNAYLNSGILME